MKQVDAILDGTLLLRNLPNEAMTSPEVPEPSEALVRESLQRIASSQGFDAPERSRRLLDYIVTQGLAGRGDRIKAYSIATEVLGRPDNFDPQKDPIVRIEAARLRRALEHYYLTDGVKDPLVISIPKGGYTAIFRLRERPTASGGPPAQTGVRHAAVPPGATGRNRLIAAFVILTVMAGLYLAFDVQSWTKSSTGSAVLAQVHTPGVVMKPLVDLTKAGGSDLLVQGLTERIIERVSRFRDITVIASDGATGKPSVLTAKYEFGGTVRMIGESLVVQTRLVDRTDGRVLWADNLEARLRAGQIFDVETQIANQIATKIGEPNGIIFKADRNRAIETPPENWDAYLCMLHAYAYRATFAAKDFASVRSCLESAVAAYPDFATAWALLSLTDVDEFRFFYPSATADAAPALTRAYQAARRAIDLEPTNIRGQQALMMTLFFRKDYEAAIATGRSALSLNPNDTEFKGEYGYRLAVLGNWDEGCKLVREAFETSAKSHPIRQSRRRL